MIERIDEMDRAPVIGRFYMVPTVLYPWFSITKEWPVLGPKHSDAEHLNFPHPHYHVDGRFLTASEWARAGDLRGAEYAVAGAPLCRRAGFDQSEPHPAPIYRKRRCARDKVDHPVATGSSKSPPFDALHADYLGHQCPKGEHGWICPHRGLDLGSIKPDEDGTIVCPLHGLRIDAESGRVVPTLGGA